ncbi:MAG: polyphenol oxidase family protein [Actinobacteria bacterium]|nr:polyphenol oxidase family protein [Actinomycetota bacterium]
MSLVVAGRGQSAPDPGVQAARAGILAVVGATPGDAVFMEQVHGGRVARVTGADRGRGANGRDHAVPGCDALVTSEAGLALVVLVADCVPVLLVDPGGSVAAVHAGRGGVVAGVVPAAVDALGATRRADVLAVLGPAIGGCCYEVPPTMADAVCRVVPAAHATTTWGTRAVDLPAAVTAQLAAAGVRRVRLQGGCTRCGSDRWFSHRAAREGTRTQGRQAGVIHRQRRPGAGCAGIHDGVSRLARP